MDLATTLTMAVAALAGTTVIAIFGLKAFQEWVALKRFEFETIRHAALTGGGAVPTAAARIDVADLKERIRKLEAIAAGVDL